MTDKLTEGLMDNNTNKTYTKKHLILTAVISPIITILAVVGVMALMTLISESKSSNEAEAVEVARHVEILDADNVLEESSLTSEYILSDFYQSLPKYFNYESFKITQNNNGDTYYITLEVTDESFGRFVGESYYGDDSYSEELYDYLEECLTSSLSMLGAKSDKSINSIELTTPSSNGLVFLRVKYSGINYSILERLE